MQIRQLAATNSVTLKTLLVSFDTTDRQLGQNLRSAVTALNGKPATFWAGIGDIPQAPPETGPTIPQDKSPEEVKTWWDSLSQADKDRLMREQPDNLGNLNGIPVEDRSKANIETMNRDISRVENATEAIPYDDMQRYYNAIKIRDGLAAQHAKTGAETYLYVYEPNAFGNQGRAAIAIGNPDKADNTAVVVPGTGNSVESGWLSQDDAARVYDQTSKADPPQSTAVVAWMGYDAPDSMADVRVGQPDLARQGGDLLASDVSALTVTTARTAGRPIRRAARYDGILPLGADAAAVACIADAVAQARGSCEGFDIAVAVRPGDDIEGLRAAGATWALHAFWPGHRPDHVHRVIARGVSG